MAELLVTGGAGFIGANFVRYWAKNHPGDGVTVLDCLSYAGSAATIAGVENVDLVIGDICDTRLVEKTLKDQSIDTIIHFAAESHVDRSISAPDAFITTNIIGTHSLLKAARSVWLGRGSGMPHRFHHVSTDEVFGSLGPEDPRFCEISPYAPSSPYSASKAASDHLVRAYHHTYGLQTTASNCSNNYGPYQFPEKLIPLFLLNALHGRPLPIYGDGMNVRDWLHVDDHCRAIERILAGGRVGETYNIGGGEELTNLDVISRICRGVDLAFAQDAALKRRFPTSAPARGLPTEALMTFVSDRAGHDRRYAIDESKIRRELGFLPRQTFSEGLGATLAWYLHNERWWGSLMNGAAVDRQCMLDDRRAARAFPDPWHA